MLKRKRCGAANLLVAARDGDVSVDAVDPEGESFSI